MFDIPDYFVEKNVHFAEATREKFGHVLDFVEPMYCYLKEGKRVGYLTENDFGCL
jgi:hypothetical protein